MMQRCKLPLVALLLVAVGITGATTVNAATVKKRNLADLISMGDVILFGTVARVTDGFDANNVPYTEVTVTVSEALRGTAGGTYTFRQFGLIKPRDMGNGLTNLNVTPDGWPTYSTGEEVALFLYKAAGWTGLRTTVGLFQGKFTIRDGAVSNIVDNEGLFDNMAIDKRKLSEKELEMVSTERGRVSSDVFTSFVRKAVHEGWFDQEQEGR